MSGGKGGSSGSNSASTNSSSTQTPPSYLNSAYQQLVAQAQANAAQPLQQYQGQIVAPFNSTQGQAFGEVQNAQGAANPYLAAAQGAVSNSQTPLWDNTQQYSAQNVQNYYNPYQNDVINSTMANINESNAEQQTQLQGNAISAGAWGGDRAGVAAGELARQQGLAAGQTLSQLENQGYTQAQSQLNTQQQLQLGANEANSWLNSQAGNIYGQLGNEALNTNLTGAQALLATGNQQQAQNQANLNVPYEEYLQQQAYPFQTSDYLASILEGTGAVAGGTTTGTSTTTQAAPSTLSQILGGITGATGVLGETGAFGSNGYLTNLFGSSPSGTSTDQSAYALNSSGNGNSAYDLIENEGSGSGYGYRHGGVVPRSRMAGGGISGVPNLDVNFIPVQQPVASRANFPTLPQPQQQQGSSGGSGGSSNPLGMLTTAASLASMFRHGGVIPRQRAAFGGIMGGLSAARHLAPRVNIAKVPDLLKVPKFDDGGGVGMSAGTGGISGLVPSAQTMNPVAQQSMSNIQQMPTEKLQEMAARIPANTPQGAMIRRALQQKQMMPNAGGASGTSTAQTPMYGGYANGGRTNYKIGGDVLPLVVSGIGDVVGAFFGDPMAGDQGVGLLSQVDGGKTGGQGLESYAFGNATGTENKDGSGLTGAGGAGMSGATTAASFLKTGGRARLADGGSDDIVTDDDGNSIPLVALNKLPDVSHGTMPSGGIYPDLPAAPQQGIAAKPQNDNTQQKHDVTKGPATADPWLALMDAGFTTMGGSSPNAWENIGKGAAAGVKQWSNEKQQAADANYKSGELDRAADQLSQEAEYHKASLSNEAERLDLEKTKAQNEQNYRNQELQRGKWTPYSYTETDPTTGMPVTKTRPFNSVTGQFGDASDGTITHPTTRGDISDKEIRNRASIQATKELQAMGGQPPNGETPEAYVNRRTGELSSYYSTGKSPAGATQAKPPNQLPPAVLTAPPDMNSRVIGQTYQTPRGPMIWQAGGWAPAPQGNQ